MLEALNLRVKLNYKISPLSISFQISIYVNIEVYKTLAEVPGVARGNFFFEFQPIQSSRLAGYREHIYECLVLLYRFNLFLVPSVLLV